MGRVCVHACGCVDESLDEWKIHTSNRQAHTCDGWTHHPFYFVWIILSPLSLCKFALSAHLQRRRVPRQEGREAVEEDAQGEDAHGGPGDGGHGQLCGDGEGHLSCCVHVGGEDVIVEKEVKQSIQSLP